MNVHLYGPMSLIDGLMGSFRKGTRIINVSSEYGQLANLSEAYRAAIQAVEDPYVITTVQARGGIQGLRVVGLIRSFDFFHAIKFDASDKRMQQLQVPAYRLSKACLCVATACVERCFTGSDVPACGTGTVPPSCSPSDFSTSMFLSTPSAPVGLLHTTWTPRALWSKA